MCSGPKLTKYNNKEMYLLDAVRFTHETNSDFFGWLFKTLPFPVTPFAVAGGFLLLNCLKTKKKDAMVAIVVLSMTQSLRLIKDNL